MLSQEEYIELWTTSSPNGFGQTHSAPCYDEYVIRENQLHDYLDMFRGRDTRGDYTIRRFQPIKWYYEHPFLENLNENKVKYILIGEAAPPLNPRILKTNENGDIIDKNNSYFYDITHNNSTPYLKAPCDAFGIKCTSKRDKLVELSKEGVLLLDVFPFAVSYSSDFRNQLITNGATNFFWKKTMNLIGNSFKNAKISFIAPPELSNHIASNMQNENINITKGENKFNPKLTTPELHRTELFFCKLIKGTIIISNGKTYDISNNNKDKEKGCIRTPIYACASYDGSGYPNAKLIIRSFEF